jgi:tyrosine-protein phosphatase OCA6
MSDEDDKVSHTVTPPFRFGIVEDHPPLYRGCYPLQKNLRFLERLRLKTIVSITPEPLGEDIATWCSAQGVRMMHLKIEKHAKTEQHPIGYYETKQAIQVWSHNWAVADVVDVDQSCSSTYLYSLS